MSRAAIPLMPHGILIQGCEGRSFVLAEAREMLLELLARQEW